MYSISLSIDRLRHLLREIDENNLDYRLHSARDVPGLAPTDEDTPAQEHKEKAESRAETASKKVVSTAKEGAGDAAARWWSSGELGVAAITWSSSAVDGNVPDPCADSFSPLRRGCPLHA